MVLFISGINHQESAIDTVHLYDAFEWIIASYKILNSLDRYDINKLIETYNQSFSKINTIDRNIYLLKQEMYNNDDRYYQYNMRCKISQYTYARTLWNRIQRQIENKK